MSFVGTQKISIDFCCISCLSQCKWMLMCRSLVYNFIILLTRSQIVCQLSHLIMSALGRTRVRAFIRQKRYIAFLAVCNTARSSASVEDVVTISCLFALHAIAPPKSFIRKLWKLFWSIKLLANEALLAHTKNLNLSHIKDKMSWASPS